MGGCLLFTAPRWSAIRGVLALVIRRSELRVAPRRRTQWHVIASRSRPPKKARASRSTVGVAGLFTLVFHRGGLLRDFPPTLPLSPHAEDLFSVSGSWIQQLGGHRRHGLPHCCRHALSVVASRGSSRDARRDLVVPCRTNAFRRADPTRRLRPDGACPRPSDSGHVGEGADVGPEADRLRSVALSLAASV